MASLAPPNICTHQQLNLCLFEEDMEEEGEDMEGGEEEGEGGGGGSPP